MTKEKPDIGTVPVTAPALERELARERRQAARRVSLMRFLGVSLFLGLFLTFGVVLNNPAWQGNLWPFTAYWLASAGLLLAARTSPNATWVAALAIGFVDIPMVFFIQYPTLDTSPSSSGVAGFTLGVFALLIVLAAFSLENWQIYLVAALACVFEILLQSAAGVGLGARMATVIVLGLTGAACAYASERLRRLIERIVTDLEEREQLQSQLRFADRIRSLGTMAAGIAHEINNPLTYVIGNLEFLLRNRVGPGESAEEDNNRAAISDALQGAGRVKVIVQGLKSLSQQREDPARPVDVHQVLNYALKISGEKIRRKARLMEMLGNLPPVLGDEGRLGQVFINLLMNAADAIEGAAPEQNLIAISTQLNAAGQVVVEIRDTGAGIAPEHLSQLFDPFFTTKHSGLGTGLGLSISHGIVTAMGGAISVESAPAQGSLFRVVLPAMAQEH